MQTFDPKSRLAAVPLTTEFDPPKPFLADLPVTFDYDTYSWYELTAKYPKQLHATLTPVGLACHEFLRIRPQSSEASFLLRGTRYLAQWVTTSVHHPLNRLCDYAVNDLRHLIGYKLSGPEFEADSLQLSKIPKFDADMLGWMHDFEMKSKGVKPLEPMFDFTDTPRLNTMLQRIRGEMDAAVGDLNAPLLRGELGVLDGGIRIISDEPSYLERPAIGRLYTSTVTSDSLTAFPTWTLDEPLPSNWPRPPGSMDLPGTITIDQTTRADRRAYVFGPASHVTRRRGK